MFHEMERQDLPHRRALSLPVREQQQPVKQ
jgi:hypothetical protein